MHSVNIRKPVYAMSVTDGQSAELTFYGEICETRPMNWWTGEPEEGQFVTLDEFLEDLSQIEGCKTITVRINSYGGDAGVSNMIHNRLRELARNGASLTGIVDGVAMSGGSLIMCACDKVQVNPSSLIMIHKCWCFLFGGYNADELSQMAESNSAWDRMQAEIYRRKTGLDEEEILAMMAETTYMTGREAVERGFADELIEDAEPLGIAASADGRSLFVRGRQMHLAPGMFAPDSIPTVTPEASAAVETIHHDPSEDVAGGEGGTETMTMEELRAQYPDLIAQVEAEASAAADHTEAINAAVQEAVQAERERMAAIDEVAGLFDPDLVREAKYGENPCNAAQLALNAAQAAARAGSRFLADAREDANDSGAAGVSVAPPPEDGSHTAQTNEELLAAGENMGRKISGREKEE